MARITRQPTRKTLQPNDKVTKWINELLSTETKTNTDKTINYEAFTIKLGELLQAWPIVEEKTDLFHWSELLNRFDSQLEEILNRCIPVGKLQSVPLRGEEKDLILLILEFSRILLETCSSRNIYHSYDRLNNLLRCEDILVLEKTLELLLIPARKIESQKSLSDKFDNLIDYRVVEVLAHCVLPPINQPSGNENIELLFSYSHFKLIDNLLSTTSSDNDNINIREQLEYCRLLALSIYLMMSSDIPADVTGFSINPTIIADTTKLLSATPSSKDMKIEIGALSAMRGFLKFDSKWTETIYSMDAAASHGPIATIFKTISHCILEKKDIPYNQAFMAAFYDLTTSMANCAEFDESLVTSTVIDDIVRCIPTCEPRFYKVVERLIGVLDPLIQYMTDALDAFFSADGLSVIVKHIAILCEISKEEAVDETKKLHISYLSSLMRFILKLLTQFGSNDRLRNLIEGSLFKSIKLIFETQEIFGADVFYSATHILSTFIHTEPTSLSILQEGGVPQTLLKAISEHPIPSHAELLIILPQAFDAICLNSTGLGAFIDSDPLPNFLRFLSDPIYFRALQQNQHAVSKAMAIGDAMNEFMRHHPNLSSVIIPNLVEAVDLLQATFRNESEEISVDSLSVTKLSKEICENEIADATFDEILVSEGKRRIDPLYISMMESLCLFIESIVKTPAHRDAFMAQRGVAKLLECYTTPALPADFTNSQACTSINHCFHVLSETDPVSVMADISSYILATKERLDWFIGSKRSSKSALLNALVSPVPDNEWKRVFKTIHCVNLFGSLVALLADLCFAQHMNFSRTHAKVIPAILEQENIEGMMEYIGHLMRCCLYEYWALRKELSKKWLASACRFSQLSSFKNVREQELIPVPAEIRVLSGVIDPKVVSYSNPEDVRIKNLKACLTILRQVPTSVIAFFSGLARSLASRRTVSTVLAELSPEQISKGLQMLVKAVEFSNFVKEQEDVYLRNRLISAGISLTNLVFIDESNFKMCLHLQALGIYRSHGCFEKLSEALEIVFASIKIENGFEMISVNDVFESIYGVLARITDETLLRGNYWEEIDTERYNELPFLFEFSAKWTTRIICEFPRLISLLSIECIQLIFSTSCNLLLLKNNLHLKTNLCTLLEELRNGSSSFVIDKVSFNNLERFENFIEFKKSVNEKLFDSLVPLVIQKSKDLTYDLAQLLTRFSVNEEFFYKLCELLLNSEKWSQKQIALNSQIISIILNSPYRCQVLLASGGEKFCNFYFKIINEIINEKSSADQIEVFDRNLLISSFGLVSAQVAAMFLASEANSLQQIPLISSETCLKIYSLTLDYLNLPDLSVDAMHALLMSLSVLSRNHQQQQLLEIEKRIFCSLLPIILKASTKCLESEDPRHKSTVSLVALILRHFVESPEYLTALFQQEITVRFKGQTEPAFESDDLIAFAEPFLLRNIPCAREALIKCFGVDVFAENVHEKLKIERASEEEPDNDYVTLYSLKATLSAMLTKRQEKLHYTIDRSNEEFTDEQEEKKKIILNSIVVPKAFTGIDVMKVLKNPEMSPMAKEIVSCIIDQLMETNFTIWPQSSEELKSLDSNELVQSSHFYRCGLLLFLSELILAYPVCHSAFMTHPKATQLITFLLNVMTPYGNVRYMHINQAYERSWVQYLLINTCMGSIVEEASLTVPGNKISIDKLPESMGDSCKFVVDCLFNELKKIQISSCASSEDERELQIGRIFGLSDTIFCLLTIKSSTVGRWAPSMTAHLASLLIENRAIHHLSCALQFIDSNNPAYEEVTVNVVRTLEALCKYSNRLSKLAAKKSGIVSGAIGGVTDFSQLLQDFSSDDSGYSDDYGYESDSQTSENDEGHSEIDSDSDTDDSEMDSDEMDEMMAMDDEMDSDITDSDSEMTSEEEDDDDIIDMNINSGDLSNVRGRNTRIATSGPYELIVEEIDEEEDDEDEDNFNGARGFPVGSEDEEDVREYDYNHHHHHHRAFGDSDDFDSDIHDHIDHDDEDDDEDMNDDEEEEMMMIGGIGAGDDEDWNDQGPGHMGHSDNIADFMEFPGGHLRSRNNRRTSVSGVGRHRNELNVLLNGLNGGGGIPASYSGQVRLGADSGIHPLIARPVLDPLADPLRAHLPLTQPVQTNRPMSVVIGRGSSGEFVPHDISLKPSTSSIISKVNAEPFHFPQAVATNRRWQQDIKFTFSDLTRVICTALKETLEKDLKESSLEWKEALESLDREESRVMEIVHEASDTKNEDKKIVLQDALNDAISKAMKHQQPRTVESPNTTTAELPAPEFIDEGMDVEFFQAVPIDFYEEIIQQHLTERRNRIPVGCERVTISTDFLTRLTPVARDMYVRMSDEEVRAFRMFSSRSNRVNSPQGSNGIASINSSSSTFRNVQNIIEELSSFLTVAASGTGNEASLIAGASEPIPEIKLRELPLATLQSISTVDPSSLVSILRSYYSPVISERRLHHKLFQSLVANPHTRIELINLLIYVLERMPADMTSLGMVLDGYVESLTNPTGVQPGKAIKRSRSGTNISASGTCTPPPLRPQTPLLTDSSQSKTHIPVLQRTLQLLLHLCSHNEDVCVFFTTPVEKPWTIKRHDRSGIHKRHSGVNTGASPSTTSLNTNNANNTNNSTNNNNIMTITTKYPLVLVLACLERGAFAESSLLIEYLLHLLDTVTAPLSKIVNPQDIKIEIPQFLLHSLVRTLVSCEFTPKAFQYASHVFQHLAVLSSASSSLLNDLCGAANKCVDELLSSLKELRDPGKVDMKKFSQSKAAPSKFLRLIRTTSSLCLQPSTRSQEDRAQDKLVDNLEKEENTEFRGQLVDKLRALSRFEGELEESFKYGESVISASTSVNNINISTSTTNSSITFDPESLQFALVLLPVIESFFLVHRLLQALTTAKGSSVEPSPVLVRFAEEHRSLLNSLIRTKPSLLTQGSLVTLTRLPRVLDFDNKRIFFRQQLHRKKPDQAPVGTLNITVRRAHVFEDSFLSLQGKTGDELKWGRLSIKFAEEEGVDAGGVTREWFSVLSRQMFNPDYALFRTSAADQITYQPNKMSYINPDHLLYFHFIGRIIGKAVFDSRLLDCHFTRSFYKHILSCPVETKDMEAVDMEMYKSLCWIVENDITGVFDDLTFTTDSDEFGTVKSVELKEGGANIFVNEGNKKEYVKLLTEFKLTTAIQPQIDSFLRGFHEIISAPLISIFNEQELELLISGMPEIDLDDWRGNCEYQGGYTIASPQVQWFWRAVRSFDSEIRAKLIQFVTGTSKVPLEGFSKLQGSDGIQKFQIHRDPRTKDRLPTAHTCFNQLDLPEYETYEELRQQLFLAINEGETGFGFI